LRGWKDTPVSLYIPPLTENVPFARELNVRSPVDFYFDLPYLNNMNRIKVSTWLAIVSFIAPYFHLYHTAWWTLLGAVVVGLMEAR
jgi:hypothetical protein